MKKAGSFVNLIADQVSLNRVERKFLIPPEVSSGILHRVQAHLPMHSQEPDGYGTGVRTVYFDTMDFTYYKLAKANPERHFKVRLKEYFSLKEGEMNLKAAEYRHFHVYLELKMRVEERTQKIRIPVQKTRLSGLREGKKIFECLEKYPFSREHDKQYQMLDMLVREYSLLTDLLPVGYVEYSRRAFQSKDGSLRVSFDQNIKYFKARGLLQELINGYPKFPILVGGEDEVILEVKNLSSLPSWLVDELNALSKDAYSKFKTCCRLVRNDG